jgi:type IV fimbrial biogenesis protein FimT
MPAAPRRFQGRHSRTARGFTLVELVVTMGIVAILATLAVPSFNGIALSSKLNGLASSFVSSVQLARSEAIKRNKQVTLCASSDGSTCSGSWKDGWVVRVGGTVIQSQAKLPNGFLLSEKDSATSILFRPTGVGATVSNLTLCRATPTVGEQKRTIKVSATGRPDVAKVKDATSCP